MTLASEQIHYPALANQAIVSAFCQATPKLNTEQQVALTTIAQCQQPVMLLQGLPGTGKTTLLAALQQLIRQQGATLLAAAPTNKHRAFKRWRNNRQSSIL